MIRYEYKVIPAPTRGLKGKGVKGPDSRFANALETLMNEMGADGWDYQRAETLPSEERAGLTGKNTIFRNVLVFRRKLDEEAPLEEAKLLNAPEADDERQETTHEDPADSHAQDTAEHDQPNEDERA